MIWNSDFWPRPRYVAGGGDALVALEVCGQFEADLPDEFAMEGVRIALEPNHFARFGASEAEMLRQSNLEAAPVIEAAPHLVSIRGVIADPPDLEYLRRALGLISDLLDCGGVGVVDPQTLQLFSPQNWRETYWSGAFEPASHATILLSMEDDKIWLHTRGMRLFGRPDISCHGVRPEEVELLQPVFNGLIRMQAAGAMVPDGQIVQGIGLDSRLICRVRGALDDPDFSNFHIELEWEGNRE